MANLRPFQIILMAVFGFVALVGLYVFATFSGFGNEGTSNVGTVTIWGPLPADGMKGALESLAATDPGYSSVTYAYVRPESFSQELANALAAGTGPDLVLITQEQLVSEMPKLELIPFDSLPERTYRDTYASEFDLFLTGQGTYGVPFLIDPLVLYYNRAILASAGVATPPTTWEAVTGLVPKLTQKSGESVVKSTVPFGGFANVANARAILSALFLQAGSPITEWKTEGIRSALGYSGNGSVTGGNPAQSALSFYTQFADPAKSLYTWSGARESSRQAFLAGDLAFYPGFASEMRALRAANPNLDFDMAPLPQPATAVSKKTYGVAYAFAIPKLADNKSGAFSAAFALSSEGLVPLITERTGIAPAHRSLLGNPPADLYSPVFYPEALIADGWLSPAPAATDGIFAGMIQNVISGRTNVSEALSAAGQSIDAQLR